MGFQALSNQAAGVGDAGNCGSCGSQVWFQTILQAASIVFFFLLLNTFCLETLTRNQQLNDKPIFGMHTRQFKLLVPSPISVGRFDSFRGGRGGVTKGRGTYPTLSFSPFPSYSSQLYPSSSSYILRRWRFDTLGSLSSLSLSSNRWRLSTAAVLMHPISKLYWN